MATTGFKVSENIEQFLKFYNEANSRYNYAYDMVNQCDKLKCDLLHKLELGQFSDRNEKRRIFRRGKMFAGYESPFPRYRAGQRLRNLY